MGQITERSPAERQQALAERLAAQERMPWSDADVAVILSWVQTLDAVSAACGYSLLPEARFWSMDTDALREHAAARGKRRNRRAGYTALKSKYGDDVAKNIISRANAR